MLHAIVRLGFIFLLVAGAGRSVRADPTDLVKAGADAVQQARWDEAISLSEQAIAARGLSRADLAAAHNHRGYAYFAKGQLDQAIADYGKAIRLAPDDADAYGLRGWAYFTKGSMNQAIADSTAAIRIGSNLAFAYRNRGRAQLYSGRTKAAADDFAAAVRIAPTDTLGVIWLHVARVRSGHNDLEEFRANIAKIDRSQWPGTLIDVVIGASNPDHVGDIAMSAKGEKTQLERRCDAQVYLGLLQLAAGDKPEAASLFKTALQDCPSGVAEVTELAVAKLELKELGSMPAGTARAPSGSAAVSRGDTTGSVGGAAPQSDHNDRGYAYFGKGQVDQAIREYSSAIRAAPNDAYAHMLRGWAHFTKGAMKQSVADFGATVRLDPSSAVALRERGRAHLYAGQPKLAADDFAAAVRLAPSDALAVILLHVARVRAGQQDVQELRANLVRVDRHAWPGPLVEVLTGAMTPEQVGDIAMSANGDKTQAERVCDAQVYFGLLQLAAGDRQEARKLFSAAVADCPAGATAASELATAKLELKALGSEPASTRRKPVAPKPPVGPAADLAPQNERSR